MGVVTRAMAKQQVGEADGDNLHDEGSTVEDNIVDDEHPSSVEKQPVNQASTDDTEGVPKLTFTCEELLQ